jgi:hypothetical protein
VFPECGGPIVETLEQRALSAALVMHCLKQAQERGRDRKAAHFLGAPVRLGEQIHLARLEVLFAVDGDHSVLQIDAVLEVERRNLTRAGA